jgi:HEAT repeat protein
VPGHHEAVCEALANLGEPAAKPLLADVLRATSESGRVQALTALVQVGTKETIAALQEYLVHCPPAQKRPVRDTIQKIEQRLSR